MQVSSGPKKISKTFKTFEDKKLGKLFDLRSQRFSSFYLSNDDENLFKTELKVKGNLLDNLENVEKLL